MRGAELRAARANRDFYTDEKRIRTKIAVMVNPERGVGVLHKIVDCERIRFLSVRNQRSARTGFSSAQILQLRNKGGDSIRHVFHNFQFSP